MSQPLTAKRLAARAVAWVAWTSGLTRLLRNRRAGEPRVYILEYHGVDAGGGEWEGTISQQRFRRHLSWLRRHYAFATVADAAQRLSRGRLEQDLVAITFDDGYANNVEGAFPVLRELELPATIYLATAFLDGEELWFDVARRALAAAAKAGATAATPPEVAARLGRALEGWPSGLALETAMRRLKGMSAPERLAVVEDLRRAGLPPGRPARPMSWDQARQLRDAGIELGAHTVNHPILSRLEPEQQEQEVLGSRDRLTAELGAPPRTFAMPNGGRDDYDLNTLESLRRAGFLAACTTRRGPNQAGCDLLQLRRIGVGSDPVFMLAARLAGLFDDTVRRFLRG